MTSPRFQSRYSLDALVSAVAKVALRAARVAQPAAPERVSQRRYDAMRARAGYGDAPTAKQTAARLGMGWSEVLAFALDPELTRREIALGRRLGQEEEPWLGEEVVRMALRTVALRLGKKTLRPAEYRAERERMLSAARRSKRHQNELRLPTEGQIERVAGDWEQALEFAGLKPRPRQESERGVSVVDALEFCLEAHGALPSLNELVAFARTNDFALARRRESWSDYLVELRRRRGEWGKWTPSEPPVRRVRPDYRIPVALPPDLPTRVRGTWTRVECLTALACLLAEPPGERLTLRRYQQVANERADLPPLVSIQRHGKFSEMVEGARSLPES